MRSYSICQVAQFFEKCSETQGTLAKKSQLHSFLANVQNSRGVIALFRVLGGRYVPNKTNQLSFSQKSIAVALEEEFQVELSRSGDLNNEVSSKITQYHFVNKTQKEQHNEKSPVLADLLEIAQEVSNKEGLGSQAHKIELLRSALRFAQSPLELKWIVSILNRSLSIGISRKVAFQVFNEFRSGLCKENESLLSLREIDEAGSDIFGIRASEEMEPGETDQKAKGVILGSPIPPMLARPVANVDEFLKTVARKGYSAILLEKKFDGERVQIHFEEGKLLKLFSRSLETYDSKYSFLHGPLLKELPLVGSSCVLDGEIIGVNEIGEEDFSVLQKLGRKSGDSVTEEMGTNFQIKVFDVLFLNGESIMDTPELERKKLLEGLIHREKGLRVLDLVASRRILVNEKLKETVQDALDGIQESQEEGFIAKATWESGETPPEKAGDTSTAYQPGKKVHWFKVSSFRLQLLHRVILVQ